MNAESIYNIIVRKGLTATIRTYPSKSFNPDTNKTILGTAVDYSVKIVPPYRNREGYKPAELITSGRGISGIANYNPTTKGALAFTIAAGLILIIDSKIWTITGFNKVEDNTGILYYGLEIEAGN